MNNFENYGIYVDLVKNGYIEIYTKDLNKNNINDHFIWIMNIMKDGIETDKCQSMKVRVTFTDGVSLTLSVFEYWFNLIFWTLPSESNMEISSYYLFDTRAITKSSIKNYIDDLFIRPNRLALPFKELNNIIDDCLHKFKYINTFALYLANTVNFEDTLDLMKKYPEFNESVHLDLSNVPIEDVKNIGQKYADLQIEYIKNSDHCLKDSFKAREGINPKQFKEVNVSIGSKPDGRGSVYPGIINKSFINGGVDDFVSYAMESSVGRTAQILSKINVGTSGSFARLLEINNIDTFLHPDPDFSCNTRNFEEVYIFSDMWLKIYDMRYYRLNPDGIDYCIDYKRDKHLIGKTIYMRSPMTCASYAHGQGICRKCYGEMYHVIKDINPGKIAAELLSAVYTQMLLSAKHLLESAVIALKWSEGFDNFFEVNMNLISIAEGVETKGYRMVVRNIEYEEDYDDTIGDAVGVGYGEYITSFDIVASNGKTTSIYTADADQLYLTEDLNRLLNSKKAKELDDGSISIDLSHVAALPAAFIIKIKNKELSRTLERSKHIINKKDVTSMYDRHQIIREFITTNLEGGLNVNAVHLEVLFANQMRDPDNLLEIPNWSIPNVPYKILTLDGALTNNASITIALEYQKTARTLISPLSSKKIKPSRMDLFFMEQPQEFIDNPDMISDEYNFVDDKEENIKPAVYFLNETES